MQEEKLVEDFLFLSLNVALTSNSDFDLRLINATVLTGINVKCAHCKCSSSVTVTSVSPSAETNPSF